jgi:mannosylglycerate hydrolase MGH1-like protein
MIDPIELLAREDKWFLGCGDGILFAPPFPVWLDAPGFWDEATIYQYSYAPLFTVTCVDEEGREIAMRALSRRWTPAELTVEYALANDATATEIRTVHPDGIFVSEWRLRGVRGPVLDLVAWTAQDSATLERESARWAGGLSFTRSLLDRRQVPLRVRAELACLGGANSWVAMLSERTASQPRWALTPFGEKWGRDGLPGTVRLEGLSGEGLVYAAVHRRLRVEGEATSATFAMRLAPAEATLRAAGRPTDLHGQSATPAGASHRRWQELFSLAPTFRCSDPYLETYYWYRWYGLWLNGVAPGTGNYAHPTTCEGIAFFHQPIAYSAQCHARELRWLRDRAYGRGVLRSFFDHQGSDGSLPGRIYVNHLKGTDFYHANWGDALLALDAADPDDAFVAEMYPKVARYAEWLLHSRDAEESGMLDVLNQYETGQEFTSRYQVIDENADGYGWENRIRLKGIDVTVYGYALLRALERLAPRVAGADPSRWRMLAERTADAVRSRMWDADTGMFSDVDPRTARRTGVRAAVCFYPYFTDLATAEHLLGLERNLFDAARFWTPFPVPSSSLEDPLFDATAEWKGKRHACPWNGRVWPMTNSHIIEALARAAIAYAPHLRQYTTQLLFRFVRMMFHDGDVKRANCFEHYNPLSGRPSIYRGIDDYQHSWVNDLIIQYVLGIRPHASGITIDPFPCGLELAEITGVEVRGVRLNVRVEGERVKLTGPGIVRESRIGVPMEIAR